MKKLLIAIGLLLVVAATINVQAQGLYNATPTALTEGSTDGTIKTYGPFESVASYTVGVLYTKAATEDSLTTLEVYESFSSTAAASRYGEKVSADADLMYNNGLEQEYEQKKYTPAADGQIYISLYYNGIGTATDTLTTQVWLYVDPG